LKTYKLIEDGLEYEIIEQGQGTRSWYHNKLRHRENGPAYEHHTGGKEWFLNGVHHRVGGPAVIYSSGIEVRWYLNGKHYTKPTYYKELFKQGLITEEEYFLELV